VLTLNTFFTINRVIIHKIYKDKIVYAAKSEINMKKLSFLFIAVLTIFLLTGCSDPCNQLYSDKAITHFTFFYPTVVETINESEYSISVKVPFGTDVTALTAIFEHTGKSASPSSFVEQDFTSPVIYTVTADDGTTREYTVSVVEATEGLVYNLINGGTEYELTTGVDTSEVIIIDYIEGKKVTTIGINAFISCTNLTNISLPAFTTNIEQDAFYGCNSLTGIALPDSVESIDQGAFYNCTNLTSITIPAGVEFPGDYVFTGCSSLTSIAMESMVAPIPSAYTFHLLTDCLLHIHPGAAGYDVLPWTDNEIFSYILADL